MKKWEIYDAEDRISEAAIKESATNLIPSNSILIVNRSGILKHTLPVGLNRRPVAINQDIKAIICSDDSYPDYIAHILKAAEPIILKWVRATTADNFPIDSLRELRIPFPLLDEQRRIAAILNKAEYLRQRRMETLRIIDELTQSIAYDICSGVKDTAPIIDLFDVQGGLQLSQARSSLPVEVPYLRVANVYRSRLDISEIKKMRVTNSELDRTALRKGDLLFVEGHGNADEVGRCAVWDASIDRCAHQNHIIRARPISEKVDTTIICHWLNGLDGRRHLLRRAKTVIAHPVPGSV